MRYQFEIHTFGCKVNTYDSGLLEARLRAHSKGETSSLHPQVPMVHVLNSCAVTAEATKQAAREARRLKARHPFSIVVMTGCGAQVDGQVFDEMPAVDLVVANSHKGKLEFLLDEYFKGTLGAKVFRSNIFQKLDLEMDGGEEPEHTRSFLKIQDGCNSFCTYCVIPFARGRSRSIPVVDITRRIRELHAKGVNEVVLTGVHIADYDDQGRLLIDLVKAVLEATEIPRLRLSSLEPRELTAELLDLYQNSRLCPHLHMSIQSATTRTLQAMARKYTAEDIETVLTQIQSRVPNSFVGLDIIAGFPGETEDDFTETYERMARLPWTRMHVFPYSERPGTKALKIEATVPPMIRARRAEQLRNLSLERYLKRAEEQVGTEKEALILRGQTLTHDYWNVKFEQESDLEIGSRVRVRIAAVENLRRGGKEPALLGRVI